MKNKENEIKSTINTLVENSEEVGKLITENVLNVSKAIRVNTLGTSDEQKDTPEALAKKTINLFWETTEMINGTIVNGLIQSNKNVRRVLLEEKEKPSTTNIH
jgi:hypothetical protein